MISYKEFCKHLLVPLKEHELFKLVAKIQERFTLNRDEIKDYTLSEKEVSAYAAFYGYSNYYKLNSIMRWIPQNIQEQLSKTSLVDIGSGPGVFTMAWREHFPESQNFTLFESSNLMQMQAKKLMEDFNISASTKIETEENQTFLFGHSFNEIGLPASQKLIEKYDPSFVFFIEPGTKDVFFDLLKMRSWLIEKDYNVLYPCLNNDNCPLDNQKRDWCHQFLTISYDQGFESLCQKIRIDRKKLPMTVHLYQKKRDLALKSENQARVIRVFKENKFAMEFDLCLGDKKVKYQVMKKHYSKQEQKAIGKILSGDLVNIEVEKIIKDELWRGKILL